MEADKLMKYVGLDPSFTGFAVAVLNEAGELEQHTVFKSKPTGKTVGHRMLRINTLLGSVFEVLKDMRACHVAIEGYSYASNVPGVNERAELGGVLRDRLVGSDNVMLVHEAAPHQLKKFATGKGNGDKTAVIANVVKRWGHVFRSDDEYDAFVLARIGWCIADIGRCETAKQREVIDAILNPIPKSRKRRKSD